MFDIQKFNIVTTWNLYVLYGFRKKTANVSLCNVKRIVFIIEVESVYCTVRTLSLYNTGMFRLQKVTVTIDVIAVFLSRNPL